MRNLDFGSWFNNKYKGERIPLFHEVLELIGNRSNLEIQLASLSEDFINKTLDTIVRYNLIEKVEVTSAFPHVLMKVREYNPEIKIGVFLPSEGTWMLDDLWISLVLQTMSLIKANIAHIPEQRLNENNVLKLKENGYLIHASDCNDINHLKLAVDLNVNQISTDKVKQALLFKRESLKNINILKNDILLSS